VLRVIDVRDGVLAVKRRGGGYLGEVGREEGRRRLGLEDND
jgi:hypothetical protein